MDLLALWNEAGWFAKGIIFTLMIMSVISLGVGVQKWWRFRKSRKATRAFAPEFARFLQDEQLDAAIELAEQEKTSHVARVLGEALAEVKPLLRDRQGPAAGSGAGTFRRGLRTLSGRPEPAREPGSRSSHALVDPAIRPPTRGAIQGRKDRCACTG